MNRLLLSLVCLLTLCPAWAAEEDERAELAWQMAWSRFYCPSTCMFYDYLSSYEPGCELAHLPVPDEVHRQYPNPCGYGTGMEDCMILGGTMLETVVDRYRVTADTALHAQASAILQGIERASSIREAPGFVARGITPSDGTSYYINSSRDQYTHVVYGLWKYLHSPLSNAAERETIRTLLVGMADRMLKNVTPENEYDFLRADGRRCPLGICRMWNVKPHEAARLPMIYAAAWDATGDSCYYRACHRYLSDAIQQSFAMSSDEPVYVLVQMAYSFDLLRSVVAEREMQLRLSELLDRVGEMGLACARRVMADLRSFTAAQLAMTGPDWRTVKVWDNQQGYLIPRWGFYRTVWDRIREIGEATLVFFMVNRSEMAAEGRDLLHQTLSLMDYTRLSSCGIVYHLAAYWEEKVQNKWQNK